MTVRQQRNQNMFMLFIFVMFFHILGFIENRITADELFMCSFGYVIVLVVTSMLEFDNDDNEIPYEDLDLYI